MNDEPDTTHIAQEEEREEINEEIEDRKQTDAENETTTVEEQPHNISRPGADESKPEPDTLPRDEDITFHNCPVASTCSAAEVAAWLNTFRNQTAQSRARFHFIKKIIGHHDRKTADKNNPQFINMPDINTSNDEHTAFEKILKQACSNEDEDAVHSTISLPRELKTVEMQKITQKDKIRVNNLETLKNYQYSLRTTLHELGFEGIADIVTTTGDFKHHKRRLPRDLQTLPAT